MQKYYHRIDSVREFSVFRTNRSVAKYHTRQTGGLIGRLLPRLLLKRNGTPVSTMAFAKTQAGKPYIASSRELIMLSLLTSTPADNTNNATHWV